MKLNIEGAPPSVREDEHQVGDVYKVIAGRGGPRFQVVVAVSGETAYMLTFRDSGEICGVTQCGLHYLERRGKVGHAELPDITPTWF